MAATADRLDTLRPDVLFLSPAAARWLGLASGDVVAFQVGLAERPLRVAGMLAAGEQRFAVMDIAGAQAAFERLGKITRIDLRLRPGVDVDALRNRLDKLLPPGVSAQRPEAGVAASAGLSRSYRVNLDVLALVALFTGGLLVFSTHALSVVRRRAQFALLRVLGMTRRRLVASLVAEGALVGIVGSLIGLALGFAFARVALYTFGADLGSGYFRGVVPTLRLDPMMLVVFFALGVVTAMLASLVPALDAARTAPALALKAGDEERAFARLSSPVPGIVALMFGAAAAAMPPVDGLPLFGYGAIALLLVGTLMLLPRIAAVALAVIPIPDRPEPRLALAQLRGAPGQVTVSLAAIVASVGLMVSMAIMVASFRDSLDAWLGRILPADLYFRAAAGGDTAYLGADAQASIAALPGVRRVDFLREQQLLLDPSRPRVVLQARAIDRANPARTLPLVGGSLPVPADAPPPIWVNEAAADLYAFQPGTVIERDTRRNPRRLAQDLRPHVRGHLCAGARGGRHRPHRAVVVVRRAGACAPARVRRLAPSRHDAPADRSNARDGGTDRKRHRARCRACSRLCHQPDPDPRRQPAVIPLGDGARAAVGRTRRIRGGHAGAVDRHGARERSPRDERRCRSCREGRLVSACDVARDTLR